jgi:serine protease Do
MRFAVSKLAFPAMAFALMISGHGIMPSAHAQSRPKVGAMEMMRGGSFLGIQMEDVTAQNMSSYKLSGELGVIVKSVEKGSPAENAKLQENDVILEYSHVQVLSAMQLTRLVGETPVGRKVDLVVSRDGKKTTLGVQIGSREENARMNRFGDEGGDMTGSFNPERRSFQFRMPDGRGFAFGPLPNDSVGTKPRLGISIQSLTDQMAEFLGVPGKQGVLVASVEKGSVAEGKLKAGDVIVRADDRAITTPEDLRSAVARVSEGKMDLKIIRNKAEISVTVNLPGDDSSGQRGHRL